MPLAELKIDLRKAIESDCESIYQWRNHEKTRRFSLDQEPILWENHETWFYRTLKEGSSCLLLGEFDGRVIGVLRYDFKGNNRAEISIYLVPEEQGKGYGAELLKAGTQWVKEHFKRLQSIEAIVILENKASHKAFEKAGYSLSASDELSSNTYVLELN